MLFKETFCSNFFVFFYENFMLSILEIIKTKTYLLVILIFSLFIKPFMRLRAWQKWNITFILLGYF